MNACAGWESPALRPNAATAARTRCFIIPLLHRFTRVVRVPSGSPCPLQVREIRASPADGRGDWRLVCAAQYGLPGIAPRLSRDSHARSARTHALVGLQARRLRADPVRV